MMVKDELMKSLQVQIKILENKLQVTIDDTNHFNKALSNEIEEIK